MSNFCRSVDLSLIYCEIELNLPCLEDFIISQILRTPALPPNPVSNLPRAARRETKTSDATFQTNSAKTCVPEVVLSINDNIKFLEIKKEGFKKMISSNKYRPEITTQPKSNNLE